VRNTGGALFYYWVNSMKNAKNTTEQIELLKSRNLIFENESNAKRLLLQHSYYRLSGYWRKYQIDDKNCANNFIKETTFEKIIEIYVLDMLLRNILQKGLGIFEVCFRSNFAYYMALSGENGQFLYLQPNSYSNKISENENPEELLVKIKKELTRSNEKCIKYYREKGENVPIWAAIEILSFGTVSKMYSRWINKDTVKKVYQEFETFKLLKKYKHIIPIVHSLVYLRNLCAHQVRIWNRRLIFQTSDIDGFKKFGNSSERAQWRIISILMLLVDEINQNNEYSTEVLKLCKQNKEFYNGLIEPIL
jgi:abortive infection bacteriophage resistance protein